MPTAVWIWDLARLQQIALLVHRQPVRGFKWRPRAASAETAAETTAQGVPRSPTRPSLGAAPAFSGAPDADADALLALWTDSRHVYLWSASGPSGPAELPLNVGNSVWQPAGTQLLLADKAAVVVAEVVNE